MARASFSGRPEPSPACRSHTGGGNGGRLLGRRRRMWKVTREGTNVSMPALTLLSFKLGDIASSLMQALLNEERVWLRVHSKVDEGAQ